MSVATLDRIEELRNLADALEELVDILEPYNTEDDEENDENAYLTVECQLGWYECDPVIQIRFYGEGAKGLMTKVRRQINDRLAFNEFGKWEKRAYSYSDQFEAVRKFDDFGVTVELSINREQVCTAKVIETKQVWVPPTEGHYREDKKIEWDCGNLLDDTNVDYVDPPEDSEVVE